ncbi:AraC family transcriptional regulator [uncultured Tateyamaria sp.]|uniref:AraC family transcriptional regulator n=1 Tax=uncultured Tateyamaria sp. TaxID=455651 RepID=UPI00262418E0|nr:AraC family transcriptional regulator [uncultured Tateyamaria sp.]
MMERTGIHPKKQRTVSDYHRRIERIVDVIRARPAQPFTVKELCEQAAFSEFHFHRVFRAMTGESVAQCIIRLRLEMAASALIYRRQDSITGIALNCGFSSSANFSKAFQKSYECSPTQYRRDHPADFRMRRIGKVTRAKPGYPDNMSFDVEIRTMPERRLASLRQIGPYSHASISDLYADLAKWHQSVLGRPAPDEAISITWSDSALADQDTWRLDACYEVHEGTKATGQVMLRTLAGGRVACLKTDVPGTEMHRISACWDWLFSDWLPQSGYEPADRPAYEVYRGASKQPGFNVTLCLPLMNKHAEHDDD